MKLTTKKDMKKTYTKKQITEAIAYWKKQLKKLNEATTYFGTPLGDYIYDTVYHVSSGPDRDSSKADNLYDEVANKISEICNKHGLKNDSYDDWDEGNTLNVHYKVAARFYDDGEVSIEHEYCNFDALDAELAKYGLKYVREEIDDINDLDPGEFDFDRMDEFGHVKGPVDDKLSIYVKDEEKFQKSFGIYDYEYNRLYYKH